MQKLAPATEQFQHFVTNLRESFWGDLNGRTREAWKKFFEADSERQRDRFAVVDAYERDDAARRDYRNGYYKRDLMSVLGRLELQIARTRGQSFLPAGLERFQRRAPEVSMLIREAFLRGISTRQVGRVVAILTGEPVSAQTVSQLTRDLDEAVRQFHEAPLTDDWVYLFLDGVNLKVRRESGRKCVQMLVAYGVRSDGRREVAQLYAQPGRKPTSLGRATE